MPATNPTLMVPMDSFDFVIIGAGPAGEAAAYKARELGASVAVTDRLWFGGSCPHIGCLPSKSLLDGASRHAANPARYSWADASAQRDYMVNRPANADEPDDGGHVRGLQGAGAVTYRGTGTIVGRGRVNVRHGGLIHELTARHVMIAVGSVSKRPPIEGLDGVPTWTNREATLTRELPKSLLVLGGGPTGCELAQAYVRFGVPTAIVQSGPRLAPTDHPRNSDAIRAALERDGVNVRTGRPWPGRSPAPEGASGRVAPGSTLRPRRRPARPSPPASGVPWPARHRARPVRAAPRPG